MPFKRRHDVWSNYFYIIPGFFAWYSYLAAFIVIVAGALLGISSGYFHTNEERRISQRLDITATLGFVISLPIAVLVTKDLLFGLILPALMIIYYFVKWKINTTRHFIGWTVVGLGVLFWEAGWIALIPLIPLAAAAWIRERGGVNSVYHSLWHIGTQVAAIVYLIIASLHL